MPRIAGLHCPPELGKSFSKLLQVNKTVGWLKCCLSPPVALLYPLLGSKVLKKRRALLHILSLPCLPFFLFILSTVEEKKNP